MSRYSVHGFRLHPHGETKTSSTSSLSRFPPLCHHSKRLQNPLEEISLTVIVLMISPRKVLLMLDLVEDLSSSSSSGRNNFARNYWPEQHHFEDRKKTYRIDFYERLIATPWYIWGVTSTYRRRRRNVVHSNSFCVHRPSLKLSSKGLHSHFVLFFLFFFFWCKCGWHRRRITRCRSCFSVRFYLFAHSINIERRARELVVVHLNLMWTTLVFSIFFLRFSYLFTRIGK